MASGTETTVWPLILLLVAADMLVAKRVEVLVKAKEDTRGVLVVAESNEDDHKSKGTGTLRENIVGFRMLGLLIVNCEVLEKRSLILSSPSQKKDFTRE